MTNAGVADAAINQYLERYAEPEAQWSELEQQSVFASGKIYQHVLVIPAYAETESFLALVLQHCNATELLCVVVVNAPTEDGRLVINDDELQQTKDLLHQLKQQTRCPLLVVDRVSDGKRIPQAQGVGLARKIGTDIALRAYQQGHVVSPWLYQTDADARLPHNYFRAIADASIAAGAVVFAHRHASVDPAVNTAASLYDTHLHYYVEALAAQGSLYAYPTLGSTLAIHAHSYARVRGYPKRNAGEDFHILNKLNKLQGIRYLRQPAIEVQARLSTRVTFGTGPALQKITALLAADPSGEAYLSYDYRCFELLGHALVYLRNLSQCDNATTSIHDDRANSTERQYIEQILETLGVDRFVNAAIAHQNNPRQREKMTNEWFDALKTLRFIHLAGKHYPNTSLLQTLRSLPASLRNKITFHAGIV